MQAVLSSGSSQCCPSLSLLGGRGMSWKTNCRHPTVLPHPTSAESFSAIAPYLLVRSTLLAFFSLSSWAFWRWSLRTEVSGVSGGGGSRLRQLRAERWQLFERTSLQEPSCTSDRRAVRAQERADRPTNMSGGEILFQGWLRKSPPERKLRRYVSCPTFEEFFFFFFLRCLFFGLLQKLMDLQFVGVFVGHVRLCQPGIKM